MPITFSHTTAGTVTVLFDATPAFAATVARLADALAAGPRDDGAIAGKLDHILASLTSLETRMGHLEDAVARLEASVDAELAKDDSDAATKDQEIADLKARVAAGGLSADQEEALAARIDAAEAKLAAKANAGGTGTTTPPDQTQPPAPDQGGAPA
jgi:septal ring factor EnvC (AmiA/AmiB activator)